MKLALQLKETYTAFIAFLQPIAHEDFELSNTGKWSASEHLAHIVLSVRPLVKILQMNKDVMLEKFGTSERKLRSYEAMTALYIKKLGSGKKAPKPFDPAFHQKENKRALCEKLTKDITTLCLLIEGLSETELDQLAIPHPLLGVLSVREMMYNAIYHGQHHQKAIRVALNLKDA